MMAGKREGKIEDILSSDHASPVKRAQGSERDRFNETMYIRPTILEKSELICSMRPDRGVNVVDRLLNQGDKYKSNKEERK